MKTSNKLMIGVALFMSASMAFAQNPNDEKECSNGNTVLENNSLYFEYAKQKNYDEAYDFWLPLYETAPDYNRNLYIEGEKILLNKINPAIKAKNAEERVKYADMLMGLYDNRIKYFGDDAKMPAAKILGTKANNYLSFYGKQANLDSAYVWLSSSVTELKEDADAKVLVRWVDTSLKKYKADDTFKSDYIANYMKGSEYIDGSLDNWYKRLERDQAALHDASEENDAKAAKDSVLCDQFIAFIKTQKVALTQNFAASGAADVATLVSVFEPQLEAKKEDATFLNNVSKLLGRSKAGKETDLYFKVAEYSYQLAPSYQSAKGMANLSIKNQDWDSAIKYIEESLTHAVQPEDKADNLVLEALVYYRFKKDFSKARSLCRQAIALDKTCSDAYLYVGEMYMQSLKSCGADDPVLQHLVFVAAADEFAKGKAADSSKAVEFNTRIQQCKQQYPDASQLFMKGIQKGQRYTIGGWMQVSITIPD